jgi:hypothetical protein
MVENLGLNYMALNPVIHDLVRETQGIKTQRQRLGPRGHKPGMVEQPPESGKCKE